MSEISNAGRRSRWLVATCLAMVLFASCTSGEPTETVDPQPAPTTTTSSPVNIELTAYSTDYVQDMWVYGQIVAVKDDGELVDLTDAVVTRLTDSPAAEVELMDGVIFELHPTLDPQIVSPDGDSRDDLEVVGGVIEDGGVRSLAILATPSSEAVASVRFGDVLDFDLTHVEDLLQPGDVMLFDYSFIQGYSLDEVEAQAESGLELLRERLAAEQIMYLAENIDGAAEMVMRSGHLGVAVEGSVRANVPAKEDAYKNSIGNGLAKCRDLGPGCVQSVHNAQLDGARSTLCQQLANGGAAIGTLPDYCQSPPGPPDSSQPGPSRPLSSSPPEIPGAQCWGIHCAFSWSDPHVRTFGGNSFGMHAAGEFTVAVADDFEVQIRTQPAGESRAATLITAAAIGFGDHRITVDREQPTDARVHLDGAPISLDEARKQPMPLGDGLVHVIGDDLLLELGDVRITVNRLESGSASEFLNIYVDVGDDPGTVRGLYGSPNASQEDEFVTREGQQLDAPLSSDDLYGAFVPSWRISQEESLFDYAAGTDTEYYTDLSMPEHPDPLHSVSDDARARAEVICQAAGLTEPVALQACVIDFSITGDIDFVRSALMAQANIWTTEGLVDRPQPTDTSSAGGVLTGALSPYRPASNEIGWTFATGSTEPESVPHSVTASPIRDEAGLPIFQLTDIFDYSTGPVLRIAPHGNANDLEGAIQAHSYIEFDVRPEGGPVRVTHLQVTAAQGNTVGERGIAVRSDADAFASSLISLTLTDTRPNVERVSAPINDLVLTTPTTFRLYFHTGNRGRTLEIADIVIGVEPL